ncbi:DUF975 family protein [Cohnella abietis]|uniref:Membrane protein n=1 Tax=Cohnella abietis TaxID=2507935 RepID=A0A3T1CYT3_9BACL|nr:DUF975 family protein [Cohnella abietis]BBI30929.1 membrane protein [Cohnella abietis]
MPTSAEIRARARASLSGKWTPAVLHFLLYYVVIFAIGLFSLIPFIGWIASLLLTGALTYGVMAFYLALSRGEIASTETLFSGFSRFVETFVLSLLVGIFTLLWSLLLIIPGIIAALSYSQAYFILKDNPGIGGLEAIRRSKALMVGHKGRLFVLYLTFIGWFLLAGITFGIGYLWLAPYIYTSLGHFYNDLINRSASVSPPPSPYGNDPYAGIIV